MRWGIAPLFLLFVAACGGQPGARSDAAVASDGSAVAGSEEPSIRGTVTAVDERSVRVEEEPADSSGSAKAVVRVGSGTPIRFADGAPAGVGDLQVGAMVTVWFTGAVEESYPVQASAGAIRIDVRAVSAGQ